MGRKNSQLMKSSALAIVLAAIGAAAYAQTASPPTGDAAAAAAPAPTSQLGEIVVTATRRSETVNRVPLSIAVQSDKDLDRANIRNASDLQRLVPGLAVSAQQAGVATFAIRGVASSTGAATTGVYLDDVPIQRRNTLSAFQVNGTPAPPAFDIARVEVLRGPQGTLYGGSSEGGTVRYITTEPSLTNYSGVARVRLATTEGGAPTYETDLAVGGPIIQDKLGFRAMVFNNDQGGYINLVDPYGRPTLKDANSEATSAFRLAILAKPTDRLSLEISDYYTRDHLRDTTASYTNDLNSTISTPQLCFNNSTAAVSCAGPHTYTRPAQTYGPFTNLGPGNSLLIGTYGYSPATTALNVASFTADYKGDVVDVRSITALLSDQALATTPEATSVSNVIGITPTTIGFGLFAPLPDYDGVFHTQNQRSGVTEELRATSTFEGPLSFVTGVFLSQYKTHSDIYETQPQAAQLAELLYGIGISQRYSALDANGNPTTAALLPGNITISRDQHLTETEYAGYGDLTYKLTSKLSINGGVRVSQSQYSFNQIYQGPVAGKIPPSVVNGGITSGSTSETPVTPKFNVKYQATDDAMFYATAAEGYRVGGVNGPLPAPVCGTGLANIGLTVNDVPQTYRSDSVWSYEGGVKFRALDNHLHVAASAYRIDWTDVQLSVSVPGCSVSFVTNAGAARSEGLDLQADMNIAPGLTTNVSLGLDDARYTQTAYGPLPKNGAAATPVVFNGDKLPTSPLTISASGNYAFNVVGPWDGYFQLAYQYAAGYTVGSGVGTGSYTPDNRYLADRHFMSGRVGLTKGGIDLALYANNLLDSRDALSTAGGRSSCKPVTDASCAVYGIYNPFTSVTTYRPREVGVEANYHF